VLVSVSVSPSLSVPAESVSGSSEPSARIVKRTRAEPGLPPPSIGGDDEVVLAGGRVAEQEVDLDVLTLEQLLAPSCSTLMV
jgi:hypothetical protein